MPRASGPAVDAAVTPPITLPPLPDPLAGVPRWRFVGDWARVYTHVPVTVRPGDVIALPEIPAADGCWEHTTDAWTVRPDNYTPEV